MGAGGRVARRARGTDERRAELLKAARALFVRYGFPEVSVSRIVRAVGVAQGTFYYYFESKEEALDALIDDHVGEVSRRLQAIATDHARDGRAALEAMVRAELDEVGDDALELSRISGADARSKLLGRTVRALAPVYAGVIRRGQEQGRLAGGEAALLGETLALMTHALFDAGMLGFTEAEYGYRRQKLAELFGHLLGVTRPERLDFGPANATPSRRGSGPRRPRPRGP